MIRYVTYPVCAAPRTQAVRHAAAAASRRFGGAAASAQQAEQEQQQRKARHLVAALEAAAATHCTELLGQAEWSAVFQVSSAGCGCQYQFILLSPRYLHQQRCWCSPTGPGQVERCVPGKCSGVLVSVTMFTPSPGNLHQQRCGCTPSRPAFCQPPPMPSPFCHSSSCLCPRLCPRPSVPTCPLPHPQICALHPHLCPWPTRCLCPPPVAGRSSPNGPTMRSN